MLIILPVTAFFSDSPNYKWKKEWKILIVLDIWRWYIQQQWQLVRLPNMSDGF
jgi:hypothetical protein